MQPAPPRRRPAIPVPDAPLDELAARAPELAKGWLLAVLEDLPLEGASSVRLAEFAQAGPRLCEALVLAIGDDAGLRRIALGGELEALAASAGEIAGAAAPDAAVRAVGALQGVIWSATREALRAPDPDLIARLAERLWLVFEEVRAASVRDRVLDAVTDPYWPRVLEEEVGRAQRAGLQLSLLLVELEEADRIAAVEGDAAGVLATFGRAVRRAVRGEDVLTRESETRVWVIARGIGEVGARALGSRIAAAVGSEQPWRGAPLLVSVGAAVLGRDGQDAETLIAHAEEARFEAAARGVITLDQRPGRTLTD